MENVGTFEARNSEFNSKFSREKILQSLVTSKEPIIFDVGAHKGESILFFSKLFPNILIHSFEPDPETFQELSKLSKENVSCHNLAFSDTSGPSSFFKNSLSHTSSLLKVNLESKDSIKLCNTRDNAAEFQKTAKSFNNEIKITTSRLDQFCELHKINHIDLLKIDTQGAEAKVLSGAGSFLKNVEIVVLEICFFDFYEQQCSFFDVEKVLREFELSLFSISQISNNPMNGRTDWIEAIYTRRK